MSRDGLAQRRKAGSVRVRTLRAPRQVRSRALAAEERRLKCQTLLSKRLQRPRKGRQSECPVREESSASCSRKERGAGRRVCA